MSKEEGGGWSRGRKKKRAGVGWREAREVVCSHACTCHRLIINSGSH